MNWYVLYTKPRNEKKVAVNLESLGGTVFCPMISVVKHWSDRKKTVKEPLLTSYVFVKLEEKDRELVFKVSGVVRYLFWLGKPAIVKDSEILAIKELLHEKYEKVFITGIQPGTKTKIEEGVFKGQLATFIEQKGNKSILILDSLGMTLILER